MKYVFILLIFSFPQIAYGLTDTWCQKKLHGYEKSIKKHQDYWNNMYDTPYPGAKGFTKCPGKNQHLIKLKKAKEYFLSNKGHANWSSNLGRKLHILLTIG